MEPKRLQTTAALVACVAAHLFSTGQSAHGQPLDFTPLVNEVSVYLNVQDDGKEAGQTLQVVAINNVKLWWSFDVELTADFNRQQSEEEFDYYLEAGIVKPLRGGLKVNVQRIHGTFVPEPINQSGHSPRRLTPPRSQATGASRWTARSCAGGQSIPLLLDISRTQPRVPLAIVTRFIAVALRMTRARARWLGLFAHGSSIVAPASPIALLEHEYVRVAVPRVVEPVSKIASKDGHPLDALPVEVDGTLVAARRRGIPGRLELAPIVC
jgi:hypothetical protein